MEVIILEDLISNNSTNISTTYVSGIIRSNDYVGGIVGSLRGYSSSNKSITENNCFHGTIVGNNYVGGVCGYVYDNCDILKNYSLATISGNSSVGGILGGSSSLSNVCLKKNVAINYTVNGNSKVGRIYGYLDSSSNVGEIGTSETNKALTTTKLSINGIVKICDDDKQQGQSVGNMVLKYKATYQGLDWDFTNTWDMQETESYPYFVWQAAPPIINNATSGETIVSGQGTNGATIVLTINGQEYQTICTNNVWSVTTSPLVAGSTIYAVASADNLSASYRVSKKVTYLGQGTEMNPYQIFTAEELVNINGNNYFKLMNDIDISSVSPWTPIGQNEAITSHLDGDNHTISGLTINTSDDYQGLFAQCNGSILKNINLVVSQLQGGNYVGALAAKIIDGQIINCHVSGNVKGNNYTGGLIGYAQTSSISQCSVSGNVTGSTLIGGVVAYASGSITQSQYQGIVLSQTASAVAGGLAGENNGAVSECYSGGYAMCAQNSSIVGGLIGKNTNVGTIANCYSTSDVTSDQNAGGLVGRNFGSVTNSYSGGNLTSTNVAAGLVGYNDGTSAVVNNCCAMNASINATSSTGIAIRVIGGIANSAPTPSMNNYALKTMAISINGVTQRIYDDNLNGTAKTDDQLKQLTTYLLLGWDFNNVWAIEEGIAYPHLLCFEQPVSVVHLSDASPIFHAGNYEDGIDYTRSVNTEDTYAAFCLPFDVIGGENTALDTLYVPLGIAFKYPDVQGYDVLKVLFIPTNEVEAGKPFIAKLTSNHNNSLTIIAANDEIAQGVEAQSIDIIPYIYDANAVGSNAATPTNGTISWKGTFENLSNQTFYELQADGVLQNQTESNIAPFRSFLTVANMPSVMRIIAFVDSSGEATSLKQLLSLPSSARARKVLINNRLYILLTNGTRYDATGKKVE